MGVVGVVGEEDLTLYPGIEGPEFLISPPLSNDQLEQVNIGGRSG